MKHGLTSQIRPAPATVLALALACSGAVLAQAPATRGAPSGARAAPAAPAPAPVTAPPQYAGPTDVAPAMRLTVGKSALLRLQSDAERVSVGDPEVADVSLINARELYLLGRKPGSTNVFVWSRSGRTTLMDVVVSVDAGSLRGRLLELVPGETGVRVESVGDSIVLAGSVSDAVKANRLVTLAEASTGAKRVINMLSVEANQQVMLEVKVAEVSRTALDRMNLDFTRLVAGGAASTVISGIIGGGAAVFGSFSGGNVGEGKITNSAAANLPGTTSAATSTLNAESRSSTLASADIQKRDGLIRILAEPNILAISGQEGTFLAGGRIFIPVPQSGASGTTITLEEKEFGVGLRFLPTVLDEGRINLRVSPEVSELSQVGTTVRAGGQSSVLPTITTRRVSTTVQLRDGESFAIAGLIKNNVTQAVSAFPGLGEIPVLGALFRSTEFQNDRSELLFVVTPRLVKPLPANYALPTDNYVEPSRAERYLNGRLDSRTPPQAPAPIPSQPAGGFQLQ